MNVSNENLCYRGQVSHNGQMLDPDVRQIPDDVCNQLNLPVGSLVEKYNHPFLNYRDDELIPIQFWQLTKELQFNGLTIRDLNNILHYNWCFKSSSELFNNLETNDEPWKHLCELFVQSHPDTLIDNELLPRCSKHDATMLWLMKEMGSELFFQSVSYYQNTLLWKF